MHSFVILAYKESPYIEDTIKSLIQQKTKSKVVITTSTPNSFLKDLSKKYEIPLILNDKPGSISDDWNFAYNYAQTNYVTLVHQDDIYLEDYTSIFLEKAKQSSDSLIFFSNYYEMKGKKIFRINFFLLIKLLYMLPFLFKNRITNRFIRKIIVSFGSPICCPSVMYNKNNLKNFNFKNYEVNLDWAAWLEMVKKDGSFNYIHKKLVIHRIHTNSQTTQAIKKKVRRNEDEKIFREIWPRFFANFLIILYSLSYYFNKKEEL